jgi:hypothetical protein
MDLVIIGLVLLLAVALVLVRKNKPQPTPYSERELPDPQELLAGRLAELATEAYQSGRHEEAQLLRLKVAWLKSRPVVGRDEPPAELSPDDQTHLRLAGAIWEMYGGMLEDDGQTYAGCRFWPESLLPFPKEYVAVTLDLLIAIGEGSVRSIHFDARSVPPDVLESMKHARQRLDGFVDVSAEELPTDSPMNDRYGAERGWKAPDA